MKAARDILTANVRTLRHKRKWSQMKLAENASLSTGMIGDIEAGKKSPSLESLDKLANAFGVPVYYLFITPDTEFAKGIDKENISKLEEAIALLDSLNLG